MTRGEVGVWTKPVGNPDFRPKFPRAAWRSRHAKQGRRPKNLHLVFLDAPLDPRGRRHGGGRRIGPFPRRRLATRRHACAQRPAQAGRCGRSWRALPVCVRPSLRFWSTTLCEAYPGCTHRPRCNHRHHLARPATNLAARLMAAARQAHCSCGHRLPLHGLPLPSSESPDPSMPPPSAVPFQQPITAPLDRLSVRLRQRQELQLSSTQPEYNAASIALFSFVTVFNVQPCPSIPHARRPWPRSRQNQCEQQGGVQYHGRPLISAQYSKPISLGACSTSDSFRMASITCPI